MQPYSTLKLFSSRLEKKSCQMCSQAISGSFRLAIFQRLEKLLESIYAHLRSFCLSIDTSANTRTKNRYNLIALKLFSSRLEKKSCQVCSISGSSESGLQYFNNLKTPGIHLRSFCRSTSANSRRESNIQKVLDELQGSSIFPKYGVAGRRNSKLSNRSQA